ncbi:uncharacterized protein PG986_014192 [Apiospora aurea]|uniref:Uncharacterized protein n=1 Tax=Apiospora aurea TaxID=335848 RepID=A0ABR1PS97_9PEZI
MTSVGAISRSKKPKTKIGGVYRSQTPKTIIATGCSSGVVGNEPSCPILPHTSDPTDFQVLKQLLQAKQFARNYTVIIGCRDVGFATSQYAAVGYENRKHRLVFLTLEPSNLMSVHEFAEQVIARTPRDEELDYLPLDYLFLNADTAQEAGTSTHGSKWCDAHIVNHLVHMALRDTAHHYLMHLIRDWLIPAKSRVMFISSEVIRYGDPARTDKDLLAGSGADELRVYIQSKFTQLLNAH